MMSIDSKYKAEESEDQGSSESHPKKTLFLAMSQVWFGPAFLAIMFFVVLVVLLWLVHSQSVERSQSELLENSNQCLESISLHMDGSREYLLLLTEDMGQGKLDEKTFQKRASQYVADHPELINIVWADDGFVIRWTAPYEPNKQIIGLKLTLPEPERASRKARHTRQPVYTKPFEIIQGAPAFEVYIPVFQGGQFLGVFGGVYTVDAFLRNTIPQSIFKNYHVKFLGESGNVIAELPIKKKVDRKLVHQIPLQFLNNGFFLEISQYSAPLPWDLVILIILCVGLVIGMTWGMWSLKRELLQRRQAEEALKQVHDKLEHRVKERTFDLEKVNKELQSEIAERKQAENALREERDKAQTYPDIAGVMFVAINTKGEVTLINRKGCEILGYEEEEINGKNWFDNFLPKRLIDEVKPMSELLLAGEIEAAEYYENPILTKHEEERLIAWHNTILRDEKGEIIGHLSSGEDITERKKAEEALRESEEWSKTILDSIQTGILIISVEKHEIIDANPTAIEMVGDPKEQIIGSRCHKYICPAEEGACPITDLGQKIDNSERILLNADGEEIPILKTVSHIMVRGKKYLIESFIDITERKKLETQLQQAQKMESIGTLAGGIAHDFNNILFPIIGYAEMTVDDVPEDGRARRNLKEMLSSALRARDLVRQILTFSRKHDKELKPLKVQLVLREALNLIRSSLPTTIEISQNVDKDCGLVMADPTEIHQVVMNLCTNAYHAMEETGGTLEVNLNEVELTVDNI